MRVLLNDSEWDSEGHEEKDESFREVSTVTGGRFYTPQWRGLERFIFQGEAETVYC
jgi:hypothetical protein